LYLVTYRRWQFLRYIAGHRAGSTVAGGDAQKMDTRSEAGWFGTRSVGRHSAGRNLVVTYIDCISELVSDWKLIRDARLHSPATTTSSADAEMLLLLLLALMKGGVKPQFHYSDFPVTSSTNPRRPL